MTDTTLHLTAAGATHVGLLRPGNEDAYHCGDVVFAVADGLGGHAAGEVASALAIERIAAVDLPAGASAAEAQEAVAEAVRAANEAVLASAAADRARTGMGTTLTAAAVAGGRLVLAHVGDSRAYLHRDGALRQLTTDHTAAQQAVEAGYLTAEQAASHPERHVLARAVGLEPDVPVDTPPAEDLQPGDRVLLCSDGLIDPVSDPTIAAILDEHSDPAAACDALVRAALDGGGPDNVTVVIVRADGA